MKQYDLYENTDIDSKSTYPFFVDIQTDLLDGLGSRVVIPLINARPDRNLPNNICPQIELNGEHYYLLTHQITTVASSFLKQKSGSLLLSRTEIINSLDFLVSGI
jgi:toxin CcdB